jgi:uncharacterized protein YjbI with pentapeptide repeats
MSTPAPSRRLSPAELEATLASHAKWLASRRIGAPAEAQTQPADLSGATLPGSSLRGAALDWADLSEVDFQSTDVRDARFHYANLRGANLALVGGLVPGQLCGSDLTGATLPSSLRNFQSLGTLEATARHALTIMLAVLLMFLYCLLTVGSTTDLQLITNSVSTRLPVFDAEVAIRNFYLWSAIVVLLVYLYLLFQLQELWRVLSELPAFLPDGSTRTDHVRAWPFTTLAERHLPHLWRSAGAPTTRPGGRLTGDLKRFICWTVIYLPVPVTLFLLFQRYASRHDWPVTVMHLLLLVFSVMALWALGPLPDASQQSRKTLTQWLRALFPPTKPAAAGALIGLVVIGMAAGSPRFPFSMDSASSDGGSPASGATDTMARHLRCHPNDTGAVSQGLLAWLRPWHGGFILRGAELDEEALSVPGATWSGDDDTSASALELTKPAHINGADLKYASARRAFLVRAQMREVRLNEACLQKAILTRAHLEGSHLKWAYLDSAQLHQAHLENSEADSASFYGADMTRSDLSLAWLRGAIFDNADLGRANLHRTKLQGASFRKADLRGARLMNSSLDGAELDSANLEGADLRDATGLSGGMIRRARNWILARYDSTLLSQLGIGLDHNDRLEKRDLAEVELPEADLRQANLARFNLFMARLRGADLTGATLDQAMLAHAHLEQAKLEESSIIGANLDAATLSAAQLAGARLNGSSFRGARLVEAELWGAELGDARMHGANLAGANLKHATLVNADLSEADLTGAKLAAADLCGANLRGAVLTGVEGWRSIRRLERANVHGVVDPPPRFRKLAMEEGAVDLPSDSVWQRGQSEARVACRQ